jgi:hypothetical protein
MSEKGPKSDFQITTTTIHNQKSQKELKSRICRSRRLLNARGKRGIIWAIESIIISNHRNKAIETRAKAVEDCFDNCWRSLPKIRAVKDGILFGS